jgi:hypothetical protein
MLVVSEGLPRRQSVQMAAQQLKESSCNILGVVMANRRYQIPKLIYDSL